MKYPTTTELTAELRAERVQLARLHGTEDEDGPVACDVRLQVTGDGWGVHTGDPSYDLDHRGAWGYGTLYADESDAGLEALARDLLGEAEENEARGNV